MTCLSSLYANSYIILVFIHLSTFLSFLSLSLPSYLFLALFSVSLYLLPQRTLPAPHSLAVVLQNSELFLILKCFPLNLLLSQSCIAKHEFNSINILMSDSQLHQPLKGRIEWTWNSRLACLSTYTFPYIVSKLIVILLATVLNSFSHKEVRQQNNLTASCESNC